MNEWYIQTGWHINLIGNILITSSVESQLLYVKFDSDYATSTTWYNVCCSVTNLTWGASSPFICIESLTDRKGCEQPSHPRYGRVYIYGTYALYRCYNGYELVGSYYRECQNGYWSGKAPRCVRRYWANVRDDVFLLCLLKQSITYNIMSKTGTLYCHLCVYEIYSWADQVEFWKTIINE